MKLEIVICHFREKLDWLSKLKHPYIVYNKNPNQTHLFEHNLPNMGFDTYTYLTYIIDHYNKLPDYVCFAQDYPFDHCSNFVELVNEFNFDRSFQCLGLGYERTNTSPDQKYCHSAQTFDLAKRLDIQHDSPIKYISSAQCIVSKDLILKRSLESYQKINAIFPPYPHITNVNYTLEYLWPTILGFGNQVPVQWNGPEGIEQFKIHVNKSMCKRML